MRLQLTIKDLLLIVAIIALAAGWWIDHQIISKLSAQKWEYRTFISFSRANDIKEWGDEGWEVCGMAADPQNGNTLTVLLKRPK